MTSTRALYDGLPSHPPVRVWIVREISGNKPIYWTIGCFLLATALFSAILGDSLASFIAVYLLRAGRAVTVLCAGMLVVVGIDALRQKSDPSAFHYLKARLFSAETRQLVVKFSFACLLLAIFMGALLYGKTAIPFVVPFSWDPLLARWDAVLFGGQPAFRALWALLRHPEAVYLLDFLYSLWVPLVFIAWAGLFVSRISWTETKPVVKAGPIEINHEEDHSLWIPTAAGVISVIAGLGLVMVSRRA